jgi:hypothetical protein
MSQLVFQAQLFRNQGHENSFAPPQNLPLDDMGTVSHNGKTVRIFNEPIPPPNGDFHVNGTESNDPLRALQGYDVNAKKLEKHEVASFSDASAQPLLAAGTGGRLQRLDSCAVSKRVNEIARTSVAATREMMGARHENEGPSNFVGRLNTTPYAQITRPPPQTTRNTQRDDEMGLGRQVPQNVRRQMPTGRVSVPSLHKRNNTNASGADHGLRGAGGQPRSDVNIILEAERGKQARVQHAAGNGMAAHRGRVDLRGKTLSQTMIAAPNLVDFSESSRPLEIRQTGHSSASGIVKAARFNRPGGVKVPILVLPTEDARTSRHAGARRLDSTALKRGHQSLAKDAQQGMVVSGKPTELRQIEQGALTDRVGTQFSGRQGHLPSINFIPLSSNTKLPVPTVHTDEDLSEHGRSGATTARTTVGLRTENFRVAHDRKHEINVDSAAANPSTAVEGLFLDGQPQTQERRTRFSGEVQVHVPASNGVRVSAASLQM